MSSTGWMVSAGDSITVSSFAPPDDFKLALLTLELEYTKARSNRAEDLDALLLVQQPRKRFLDQGKVRVELSLVEGKERGPTIVEAARKQGVSLLVMGQKKRSVTWRLLAMWMAGGRGGGAGGSTVEYCVQHATCMALGIRRKSRRGGGYLITTRRQRDFWLLA